MAMDADPPPDNPPDPVCNPAAGVFYSFSLRSPLFTRQRRQAIAYGTDRQHEDEVLPVFEMVHWEFGQELVGTPLQFPHCRIYRPDIRDIDGPHRRTIAEIEREYGSLPPPAMEDLQI